MPDTSKKAPKAGTNPLAPRPRQKPAKKRFDPRDLGAGNARGKTRGGRPKLFPGRTGGR